MIYFLYGPDTYRSKQKLEEIVAHYKKVHKSGLNLRLFDGENLDYRDFSEDLRQASMFREKKMLILKNIFQNKEFKSHFLENGKNLADSQDIIVIREEEDVPPGDSCVKFLAKHAKSQEFKMLGGVKLSNWAKEEFAKYQAKIQPDALSRLTDFVGNNLWRLSLEAQKLAAFRRNKIIAPEDVELLVRPEIETDIFKTIEALAMRDRKKALYLIHDHLEMGDSPLYLLSMISFQFRNLLVAKKTGKLNGHPYFVRKTLWLAERFTFDELKEAYCSILDADLKIKTGRMSPQAALDLLVTGI